MGIDFCVGPGQEKSSCFLFFVSFLFDRKSANLSKGSQMKVNVQALCFPGVSKTAELFINREVRGC